MNVLTTGSLMQILKILRADDDDDDDVTLQIGNVEMGICWGLVEEGGEGGVWGRRGGKGGSGKGGV